MTLLTARELAEFLGLKPGTVLDKWERGELPGFKLGPSQNSPVRFDLDEVLAAGRRGKESASDPTPAPSPSLWHVGGASDPRRKGDDHA